MYVFFSLVAPVSIERTNKQKKAGTDRQISAVEGMYDEGLVADVYDPRDPVAGVEGGRSTGVILDRAVVVAMLDFLEEEENGGLIN